MTKRNFFIARFSIVLVLIGLFSPSIKIETEGLISNKPLSSLSTTNISITLFTEAEARRGHHRRGHRNHRRRAHRRGNYRHHHRRSHRRRNNIIGGIVAGAVIGSAISNSRNRCEVVYVRGIRYKDCGNGLRRY
ncbi:hypothetical protein MNB_SV-9-89 [hydrothermal vent metagenome]|uniref:Uncharacterized protein n=1 Tax=hydrothermal vent metagenome TaxID=652676 RepID=A0A1W1CG40_9ZZZZ